MPALRTEDGRTARGRKILSDKAVGDIAYKDLKGKASEEESRRLREPEHLRAWREHLLELKGSMELQMTQRRAKLSRASSQLDKGKIDNAEYRERKAEADEWRAKTRHMLSKVEAALRECKALLRSQGDAKHRD